MSETHGCPVVEWSPDQCFVYVPGGNGVVAGRSLEALATSLNGQPVVLAISRRASFVRPTRLPNVAKAEMGKILDLQVAQLFPLEPGQAAVDFTVLDDLNAEGRLACVAAVKTDTLAAALADAERAGIRVSAVVPAASASMSAIEGSGAVVSQTGPWVSIDLVEDGAVRSSRVIASNDPKTIADEVDRTFAAAGHGKGPVTTLGDLALPGAARRPDSALSLLSTGELRFNLELPEVRAKREHQRAQKSKNLALLLWVGALGVAAVVFDIRSDAQQLLAKGEKTWEKRLSSLRSTNSMAQQKAAGLRAQRELLDSAFAPKQRLGDVVSVFTSLAPNQLWLTGLTIERGKRATLRGTALTSAAVTNYLTSLGNQSRVRDVKLVFANNGLIESTPVVNFSISTHVVGNFPLQDEKEAKK